MRVAIMGTGGIALGYAALLSRSGHDVVLYSLSGQSVDSLNGKTLCADGAFEQEFEVSVLADMAAVLRRADCAIVATSADQHRAIFDQLVAALEPGQPVLVSGELSLGGLVLQNALQQAGKTSSVTSLSTTVLTGRRNGAAGVTIGLMRKSCKAAVEPASAQDEALRFWQSLFGSVIQISQSRLWIAFGNLNPTVHASNALCNFTRIENAEVWSNYAGITQGVANLTDALDQERVSLAQAFNVAVVPLREHYQQSFGFSPEASLSEMTAALDKQRGGLPKGPTNTNTRYITEDVPYGLVFMEHLATKCGLNLPIHTAIIDVFSSICARNFRDENALICTLPELDGLK